MTRVWKGVVEGRVGRGGLSLHPRPQKAQAPQFHEKSPYEDLAVLPGSD